MGRGFTVVHIYPHQIKRIALAIPPLSEQTAIARFLDHANLQIESYIRAKEKLIGAPNRAGQQTSLIGEYRTRLIADVVTGKLDVREAAKTLPVEAEEVNA